MANKNDRSDAYKYNGSNDSYAAKVNAEVYKNDTAEQTAQRQANAEWFAQVNKQWDDEQEKVDKENVANWKKYFDEWVAENEKKNESRVEQKRALTAYEQAIDNFNSATDTHDDKVANSTTGHVNRVDRYENENDLSSGVTLGKIMTIPTNDELQDRENQYNEVSDAFNNTVIKPADEKSEEYGDKIGEAQRGVNHAQSRMDAAMNVINSPDASDEDKEKAREYYTEAYNEYTDAVNNMTAVWNEYATSIGDLDDNVSGAAMADLSAMLQNRYDLQSGLMQCDSQAQFFIDNAKDSRVRAELDVAKEALEIIHNSYIDENGNLQMQTDGSYSNEAIQYVSNLASGKDGYNGDILKQYYDNYDAYKTRLDTFTQLMDVYGDDMTRLSMMSDEEHEDYMVKYHESNDAYNRIVEKREGLVTQLKNMKYGAGHGEKVALGGDPAYDTYVKLTIDTLEKEIAVCDAQLAEYDDDEYVHLSDSVKFYLENREKSKVYESQMEFDPDKESYIAIGMQNVGYDPEMSTIAGVVPNIFGKIENQKFEPESNSAAANFFQSISDTEDNVQYGTHYEKILENMSQKERETFYYLVGKAVSTKGVTADIDDKDFSIAQAYFSTIENNSNKRRNELSASAYKDWVEKHPYVGTAVNAVGQATIVPAGSIVNFVDQLATGGKAGDTVFAEGTRINSYTVQGVSNYLQNRGLFSFLSAEKGSRWKAFKYGTGDGGVKLSKQWADFWAGTAVSIANNLAQTATFRLGTIGKATGNVANDAASIIEGLDEFTSLGIMGIDAGGAAFQEQIDAGASLEKAAIFGTVCGGVEILTEKLGLDNWTKVVSGEAGVTIFGKTIAKQLKEEGFNTAKDALTNSTGVKILLGIGKNAVAEGLEESCSEIADYFTDILTSNILRNHFGTGDTSEAQRLYQSYIDQGYTHEDALVMSAKDFGVQVLWAGFGGAVSGVAMGAGPLSLYSTFHNTNAQGRALLQDKQMTDDFILKCSQYETLTDTAKYAKELQKWALKGNEYTSGQIEKLLNMNAAEQRTLNMAARNAYQDISSSESGNKNSLTDLETTIAKDEELKVALDTSETVVNLMKGDTKVSDKVIRDTILHSAATREAVGSYIGTDFTDAGVQTVRYAFDKYNDATKKLQVDGELVRDTNGILRQIHSEVIRIENSERDRSAETDVNNLDTAVRTTVGLNNVRSSVNEEVQAEVNASRTVQDISSEADATPPSPAAFVSKTGTSSTSEEKSAPKKRPELVIDQFVAAYKEATGGYGNSHDAREMFDEVSKKISSHGYANIRLGENRNFVVYEQNGEMYYQIMNDSALRGYVRDGSGELSISEDAVIDGIISETRINAEGLQAFVASLNQEDADKYNEDIKNRDVREGAAKLIPAQGNDTGKRVRYSDRNKNFIAENAARRLRKIIKKFGATGVYVNYDMSVADAGAHLVTKDGKKYIILNGNANGGTVDVFVKDGNAVGTREEHLTAARYMWYMATHELGHTIVGTNTVDGKTMSRCQSVIEWYMRLNNMTNEQLNSAIEKQSEKYNKYFKSFAIAEYAKNNRVTVKEATRIANDESSELFKSIKSNEVTPDLAKLEVASDMLAELLKGDANITNSLCKKYPSVVLTLQGAMIDITNALTRKANSDSERVLKFQAKELSNMLQKLGKQANESHDAYVRGNLTYDEYVANLKSKNGVIDEYKSALSELNTAQKKVDDATRIVEQTTAELDNVEEGSVEQEIKQDTLERAQAKVDEAQAEVDEATEKVEVQESILDELREEVNEVAIDEDIDNVSPNSSDELTNNDPVYESTYDNELGVMHMICLADENRMTPNQIELYNKAMSLYDGTNAKQIYHDTGMYKDKMGDWVYVLPDSSIDVSVLVNRGTNTKFKLSDIGGMDYLFTIYPELMDVEILIEYMDGSILGVTTGTDRIKLNGHCRSETDIANTLVHELQHVIQHLDKRYSHVISHKYKTDPYSITYGTELIRNPDIASRDTLLYLYSSVNKNRVSCMNNLISKGVSIYDIIKSEEYIEEYRNDIYDLVSNNENDNNNSVQLDDEINRIISLFDIDDVNIYKEDILRYLESAISLATIKTAYNRYTSDAFYKSDNVRYLLYHLSYNETEARFTARNRLQPDVTSIRQSLNYNVDSTLSLDLPHGHIFGNFFDSWRMQITADALRSGSICLDNRDIMDALVMKGVKVNRNSNVTEFDENSNTIKFDANITASNVIMSLIYESMIFNKITVEYIKSNRGIQYLSDELYADSSDNVNKNNTKMNYKYYTDNEYATTIASELYDFTSSSLDVIKRHGTPDQYNAAIIMDNKCDTFKDYVFNSIVNNAYGDDKYVRGRSSYMYSPISAKSKGSYDSNIDGDDVADTLGSYAITLIFQKALEYGIENSPNDCDIDLVAYVADWANLHYDEIDTSPFYEFSWKVSKELDALSNDAYRKFEDNGIFKHIPVDYTKNEYEKSRIEDGEIILKLGEDVNVVLNLIKDYIALSNGHSTERVDIDKEYQKLNDSNNASEQSDNTNVKYVGETIDEVDDKLTYDPYGYYNGMYEDSEYDPYAYHNGRYEGVMYMPASFKDVENENNTIDATVHYESALFAENTIMSDMEKHGTELTLQDGTVIKSGNVVEYMRTHADVPSLVPIMFQSNATMGSIIDAVVGINKYGIMRDAYENDTGNDSIMEWRMSQLQMLEDDLRACGIDLSRYSYIGKTISERVRSTFVNDYLDLSGDNTVSFRLGDILTSEWLKKYPELSDVTVVVSESGENTSVDYDAKEIRVSKESFNSHNYNSNLPAYLSTFAFRNKSYDLDYVNAPMNVRMDAEVEKLRQQENVKRKQDLENTVAEANAARHYDVVSQRNNALTRDAELLRAAGDEASIEAAEELESQIVSDAESNLPLDTIVDNIITHATPIDEVQRAQARSIGQPYEGYLPDSADVTEAMDADNMDPDQMMDWFQRAIMSGKVGEGQKMSRFYTNSFEDNPLFQGIPINMVEMGYDVKTAADSVNLARTKIESEGPNGWYVWMNRLSNPKYNWAEDGGADLDIAMYILSKLMTQAKYHADSDIDDVINWSNTIREHATKGGQFIQAFAKYKHSAQYIAVSEINKIRNNMVDPNADADGMAQNKLILQAKDQEKQCTAEEAQMNNLKKILNTYRNDCFKSFESLVKKEDSIQGQARSEMVAKQMDLDTRINNAIDAIDVELASIKEEFAEAKARISALDEMQRDFRIENNATSERAREHLRERTIEKQEAVDKQNQLYNREQVLVNQKKALENLRKRSRSGSENIVELYQTELREQELLLTKLHNTLKDREDEYNGLYKRISDATKFSETLNELFSYANKVDNHSSTVKQLLSVYQSLVKSRKSDFDLIEKHINMDQNVYTFIDLANLSIFENNEMLRKVISGVESDIAGTKTVANSKSKWLNRNGLEGAAHTFSENSWLKDRLKKTSYLLSYVQSSDVREEMERNLVEFANIIDTCSHVNEMYAKMRDNGTYSDAEFNILVKEQQASIVNCIEDISKSRGLTFTNKMRNSLMNEDITYVNKFALTALINYVDDLRERTFWQKLSTWQYLAQLLNVRTSARNVFSNAVFYGLESINENTLGLLFDRMIYKSTGNRTVGGTWTVWSKGGITQERIDAAQEALDTYDETVGDKNLEDPRIREELENNVAFFKDNYNRGDVIESPNSFVGRAINKIGNTQFGSNARYALSNANRTGLEIALDVNVEENRGKYYSGDATTSRRNFKMAQHSVAAAVLSKLEEINGYSLNWTDEVFKGATFQSLVNSYARFVEAGILTADEAGQIASKEMLYRTFQDDTPPGQLLECIHGILNAGPERDVYGNKVYRESRGGNVTDALHGHCYWVKDSRRFGFGDIVCKYRKVPGALVMRSIEYSPIGAAISVVRFCELQRDVHNTGMDASTRAEMLDLQRKTSMGFARAITGTAAMLAFYVLAKHGILKRIDLEPDKDALAQGRASGMIGTQLNVSAFWRSMYNGTTEWQDGDDLVEVGFLEPFSSCMTAATIANACINKHDYESLLSKALILAGSSVGAVGSVIGDLSMMDTMNDILYAFRSGDSAVKGIADVSFTFATSAITGMIPSVMRQAGQAFDPDMAYRDSWGTSGIIQNKYIESMQDVKNGTDNVLDRMASKLNQTTVDYMQKFYNQMAYNLGAFPVRDLSEKRIKMIRSTVPVKKDNFGDDKVYMNNRIGNILNAMMNPSTFNHYSTNEVKKEIERLYQDTDKTSPYLSRQLTDELAFKNPSTGDDEKYKLNRQEQEWYKKRVGDYYEDIVTQYLNSDYYINAPDYDSSGSDKIGMLKKAEEYAQYRAQQDFYLEKTGMHYSENEWNKTEAIMNAIGDSSVGNIDSYYQARTIVLTANDEATMAARYGEDLDNGAREIAMLDDITNIDSTIALTDEQKANVYDVLRSTTMRSPKALSYTERDEYYNETVYEHDLTEFETANYEDAYTNRYNEFARQVMSTDAYINGDAETKSSMLDDCRNYSSYLTKEEYFLNKDGVQMNNDSTSHYDKLESIMDVFKEYNPDEGEYYGYADAQKIMSDLSNKNLVQTYGVGMGENAMTMHYLTDNGDGLWTDTARLEIYRAVLGEDSQSTADKVATLMDSGFSFSEITDIYTSYAKWSKEKSPDELGTQDHFESDLIGMGYNEDDIEKITEVYKEIQIQYQDSNKLFKELRGQMNTGNAANIASAVIAAGDGLEGTAQTNARREYICSPSSGLSVEERKNAISTINGTNDVFRDLDNSTAQMLMDVAKDTGEYGILSIERPSSIKVNSVDNKLDDDDKKYWSNSYSSFMSDFDSLSSASEVSEAKNISSSYARYVTAQKMGLNPDITNSSYSDYKLAKRAIDSGMDIDDYVKACVAVKGCGQTKANRKAALAKSGLSSADQEKFAHARNWW